MINREDMLELTRRMTPSRTCFDRIAGAYISETGISRQNRYLAFYIQHFQTEARTKAG